MTVTGLSRLEDLIGIVHDSIEKKLYGAAIDFLDEMQGILNELPKDDDSKYILQVMFNGTKFNQAIAQLEVLKEESNFMNTLDFALSNEKIKKKLREILL